MNSKILMIGHFATYKDRNDGQTVKTRNIYKELENKGKKIEIIDTQKWNKKIIFFLKKIIVNFFKSDTIIIVLASNGANVMVPLLLLLKKMHKVKIYYCVVGSWLDVRMEKNKILKYCCKKVDLIFVETEELKQKLTIKGYNNIEKMYNFKYFNGNNERITTYKFGHFCTFSRVMKEKGIEDVIYAINQLNSSSKDKVFLDIYGPIEKNYEKAFLKIINQQNSCIKYIGNISPEDSEKIISQYYMLLFPTKYIKEGLPGTLIDAYNAGVPVIASNWNSAQEFVKENETGLIYEFENKEDLKKKIKYAIENKEKIENMRDKCRKHSYMFKPEEAIKPLLNILDL